MLQKGMLPSEQYAPFVGYEIFPMLESGLRDAIDVFLSENN